FESPDSEYEEFDPSTVLSLTFAGVSMFLKNEILSWLSLFFSITTIFNSLDKRQASRNFSTTLQGLMYDIGLSLN
ncbi:hypothetical protein BY996DRAFT_4578539, partial [Phakopsora pachyrhizi]